jgi:hypothetical protein
VRLNPSYLSNSSLAVWLTSGPRERKHRGGPRRRWLRLVVGILGLIASILGIFEGIDKSKNIKKYVHSSASLRAERVPLPRKLTAFAGILRGLQLECELDESDNGRLQIFEHIRDPLERVRKQPRQL